MLIDANVASLVCKLDLAIVGFTVRETVCRVCVIPSLQVVKVGPREQEIELPVSVPSQLEFHGLASDLGRPQNRIMPVARLKIFAAILKKLSQI